MKRQKVNKKNTKCLKKTKGAVRLHQESKDTETHFFLFLPALGSTGDNCEAWALWDLRIVAPGAPGGKRLSAFLLWDREEFAGLLTTGALCFVPSLGLILNQKQHLPRYPDMQRIRSGPRGNETERGLLKCALVYREKRSSGFLLGCAAHFARVGKGPDLRPILHWRIKDYTHAAGKPIRIQRLWVQQMRHRKDSNYSEREDGKWATLSGAEFIQEGHVWWALVLEKGKQTNTMDFVDKDYSHYLLLHNHPSIWYEVKCIKQHSHLVMKTGVFILLSFSLHFLKFLQWAFFCVLVPWH